MSGSLQKFDVSTFPNILVVAGAGMSVDSGLPTFQSRSSQFEFWGATPGSPARQAMKEGFSMLKLFRVHPKLAWPMYLFRLDSCLKARVHDGYRVLAEVARTSNRRLAVLTSNVDGLFARAGFPFVHECHGCIRRLQCSTPCSQKTWAADPAQISAGLSAGEFPICPWCGGAARANVSWGESTYAHTESDARAHQLMACVEEMVSKPTLLIECGVSQASGLRRYAEEMHCKHRHVFLLRINPEAEPQLGDDFLVIRGRAEPTLVELFGPLKN